jgi:hypothetical protein
MWHTFDIHSDIFSSNCHVTYNADFRDNAWYIQCSDGYPEICSKLFEYLFWHIFWHVLHLFRQVKGAYKIPRTTCGAKDQCVGACDQYTRSGGAHRVRELAMTGGKRRRRGGGRWGAEDGRRADTKSKDSKDPHGRHCLGRLSRHKS